MNVTPRIVGIIGYPLTYTLSPLIHNHAFYRSSLPFVYLPFVVAPPHLRNLLRCMRLMDVEGLNVTAPHKQTILPLLDRLDPVARRIGAVNTIVWERGKCIGYNTDAPGFLAMFRGVTKTSLAGCRVTLLGAGGTGRAVAHAVCEQGAAQLTIANRTMSHATSLVRALRTQWPCTKIRACPLHAVPLRQAFATSDVLINATSTPTKAPGALRLPLKALSADAMIIDLQYGAKPTLLVRDGKRLGFRTVDGLQMLIEQAALSFALWTGKRMNTLDAYRIVRKHLTSKLKLDISPF